MSTVAKVVVTIGALVGFLFLFGVIVGLNKQSGNSTPGIWGIILLFGLIAGLRAIWKKPSQNNNDEQRLDKS